MNMILLLITFVSSEARRIDIDADIVIPDTGGLFGYSGDITRDWGQTVPYEFDDTFSNPNHKIYVTLAMKQLEDVATCINFVDVENDPNKGQSFIRFTIADWGGHCRSQIGRQDAQPTVVTLMVDKGSVCEVKMML